MPTKKEAEIVPVTEGKSLEEIKLTMHKRQNAVETVSSLMELKEAFGTETVAWEDVEPRFDVVSKDSLEGVPFVIGGWRLNESEKYKTRDLVNPEILNPGRFVSLLVACYDENDGSFVSPWVIVNDGSTGIRDQLFRYLKKVRGVDAEGSTKEEINALAATLPPITCSQGLRPSRYPYTDDKGNVSEATTWYIA